MYTYTGKCIRQFFLTTKTDTRSDTRVILQNFMNRENRPTNGAK